MTFASVSAFNYAKSLIVVEVHGYLFFFPEFFFEAIALDQMLSPNYDAIFFGTAPATKLGAYDLLVYEKSLPMLIVAVSHLTLFFLTDA